jgi:hypothetical protein
MIDKFGLTRDDYEEQAQRRRALEFRDNMGRVIQKRRTKLFTRFRAWVYLWFGF